MLASALIALLPVVAALPAKLQSRWEGASACEYIATQTLSDPRDVVNCLKSFPFREDLRTNLLDAAERVIDFYTYETTALNAPAPYQDSTIDLRAEFQRIRTQFYPDDYSLNLDLYTVFNTLKDGHTLFLPYCYIDSWQNLLPIPIVSLADSATSGNESIYVIPDGNEFFGNYLGGNFTKYYADMGIDITRFPGAKITSINGMDPYAYVDKIAEEYSGNYLARGIRQSSVMSSYRVVAGQYSQRIGDFAGSVIPTYPSYEVNVTMIPTDSGKEESFTIPYVSTYIGTGTFSDQQSYWEANCAATNTTNGIDYKTEIIPANGTNQSTSSTSRQFARGPAVAALPQTRALQTGINLPQPYIPTAANMSGDDVLAFYMLPNTTTGVVFISSFSPANYSGFQVDAYNGVMGLLDQGADHLIIDLSGNGGGYVCDGLFFHRLLAGPDADINDAGFISVMRTPQLAQDMMASDIKLSETVDFSQIYPSYWPPSWTKPNSTNSTQFDPTENFMTPDVQYTINGVQDMFSQDTADWCTPWAIEPPNKQLFDWSKVVIVGNGQCASTCAAFSTILYEKHGVKIANVGRAKGGSWCGMSGAEVLEWATLDSEVKTANLKSQFAADLTTQTNIRHNWRASLSYKYPGVFNPYTNEVSDINWSYTVDTYNNPQALWTYTAKEVFGQGA